MLLSLMVVTSGRLRTWITPWLKLSLTSAVLAGLLLLVALPEYDQTQPSAWKAPGEPLQTFYECWCDLLGRT